MHAERHPSVVFAKSFEFAEDGFDPRVDNSCFLPVEDRLEVRTSSVRASSQVWSRLRSTKACSAICCIVCFFHILSGCCSSMIA